MARKTKKQIEAEQMIRDDAEMDATEFEAKVKADGILEEVDVTGDLAEKINKDTDEKIKEMESSLEMVDEAAKPANKTMELIELGMDLEVNSSTRWEKTGELITDNAGQYNGDADKKGMAKAFSEQLDAEVYTDQLPEFGTDRKGDKLVILKKTGKVKWSSWSATARIVQNTCDIWKGIELLGFDIVFPDGVIITRRELLTLIDDATPKKKETPLETIDRCAELIKKKIVELEAADMKAALDIIQVMINTHAEHEKTLVS